jgi:hypothetical protein
MFVETQEAVLKLKSQRLYEVLVMLPEAVVKVTDVAGINYNIAADTFIDVQAKARAIAYKEAVALLEQKDQKDTVVDVDQLVVESVQAKGMVWVSSAD